MTMSTTSNNGTTNITSNPNTQHQRQQNEHPAQTIFEINVSKDTFKFNASHFVAFPGFRERLHGHSYRASVRLIGTSTIGRDGYVLDFGCVKSVTKRVCKEMNEYFIVPMLSEVLKITVSDYDDDGHGDDDDDDDNGGNGVDGNGSSTNDGGKSKQSAICGECNSKSSKPPASVTITCEDGSFFSFPKSDCLLLPIMHSTAEELAIYLYGRILQQLNAEYLVKRGVRVMEVTVSEAVGQDAVFRREIPIGSGGDEKEFDVANYVRMENIPPMPCPTETEAAKKRKISS
mmetsp:Transcript_32914/g.67204  ORF Transcript_32914/g.67204 Transcript_32914/m.67204 type:complete len:288 (-) Transcript_32914:122-985(-)